MSIFSVPRPHRLVWQVALAIAFTAPQAWAQPVGSVKQDRQPTRQSSQATTEVPPVVYQSVFDNLPRGVETTALDWKAANANVGQFKRGYADLLKWEKEQADKAQKNQKSPPAPAAAAAPKVGDKP